MIRTIYRLIMVFSLVLIGSATLSTLSTLSTPVRTMAHAGVPPCSAVVQVTNPQSGQTLSGTVTLNVATMPNATRVLFELNNVVIGQAKSLTDRKDQWELPWDTRYAQSSEQYILEAEVTYATGTICKSPKQVIISVKNTDSEQKTLTATPIVSPLASGANSVVVGGASTDIDIQDYTKDDANDYVYAAYAVTGSGAVRTMQPQLFRYFTGMASGSGSVKVFLYYGGSTATVDIPTKIAGDQGNCHASIGTQSVAHFANAARCADGFAGVVPSQYLDELNPHDIELDQRVRITKIENEFTKDLDGGESRAIVLSGSGPSNVPVLLVFEPTMGVITQSNSVGEWRYELKDGLVTGSYDVYAAFDDGNVMKRSDKAIFAVAKVIPSDDNPNGYSVVLLSEPSLGSTSNTSTLISAVAIIAVVLGVTVIIVLLAHRFRPELLQKVWGIRRKV